ncbi:MAG: T9SS type A sorting domain-containing protein [Bacteroidia bacterium]
MRNLFLISLFLFVSMALQAQSLAPQERASLRAHMLEINAEWSHMAPDAAWLDAEIAFTDDISRIQTHLNLVVNTLRQREQEGLSAEALHQRQALLNELQAYAQRGLFPENSKHDVRIPYFIDHKGVACAVGFLMIRSGSQDVALRVRDEMNQAYVRDIPYGELPQWAAGHGFTKEELAWIQPGYPPPTYYSGLGGGTNNTITTLIVDPSDNSLILAGYFDDASGVTCKGIARWNGTAYEAIGSGLEGEVHALAFHNGDLYAGGQFHAGPAANNIARWDGQNWHYASATQNDAVLALLDFNGNLYAATSGGLVSVLNNGSWSQFAIPFNGPVHTLTDFNGDLVAGGDFTAAEGDSLFYIAKYDGQSWASFSGSPMDNTVYTLHAHKGSLYAGGKLFDDNDERTMGFAKLGTQGWEMTFDTINDPNAVSMYWYNNRMTEPGPSVRTLHSYQGGLFLGGEFEIAGALIGTNGSGLGWAADDGNGNLILSPVMALFGDTVMAMTSWKNSIVLAGSFPYWGQPGNAGNVFLTDLQGLEGFVGIDNGFEPLQLKIGPQPMRSSVTISGLPETGFELKLLDLQGKAVPLRYTLQGDQAILYRDGQASGVYLLQILHDNATLGATKLVVE